MKKILLLCFSMVSSILSAQSIMPNIDEYLARNPKAFQCQCLTEGCTMALSCDDSNLLLQLTIGHPMVQMRLLMQECSIFIDPSGKKKDKFAIILPCASYVKEAMGSEPRRPSSNSRHGEQSRPDMERLITVLNLYGATWDIGGVLQSLGSDRFRLLLDKKNDALVYSVLIPMDKLLAERRQAERWSFGIYSPLSGNMPPPPSGPQMTSNNSPHSQRIPQGKNDATLQSLLSNNINWWTQVSLDNIRHIPQDTETMQLNSLAPNAPDSSSSIDLIQSGNRLALSITINDPLTQMGTIMQGLTVIIQPENHPPLKITTPSAAKVSSKMSHHPNEISLPPSTNDRPRNRPDLRILLSELNKFGLDSIDSTQIVYAGFYITANTDNGSLTYDFQLQIPTLRDSGDFLIMLSSSPSVGNVRESDAVDTPLYTNPIESHEDVPSPINSPRGVSFSETHKITPKR